MALAKTFFEFMGELSFPRNTGRCGDRRHEHSFNHRSAGESGDSRVQSNPVKDVTSGMPLDYWPRRHDTVMGMDSAKTTGFKYLDQHDLALLRTLIRTTDLRTYFAFIAFVASQSSPGGDLRYWLHRSSITRAGWSDGRASRTC